MKVKIKSPIKGENKTVEVEVEVEKEQSGYSYHVGTYDGTEIYRNQEDVDYRSIIFNNRIGTHYGENPTQEEIIELDKKVYESYFKNLSNNKNKIGKRKEKKNEE